MKRLLFLFLIVPIIGFSQSKTKEQRQAELDAKKEEIKKKPKSVEKLKEYTASNGVTYTIGDEIELGRGSDANGNFIYVSLAGLAASTNVEQNRLGAFNAGLFVKIKKIKKLNQKNLRGVFFIVGGGNLSNYFIDIENAIATCEIKICNDKEVLYGKTDKYDQLAKIKKLFDDGVLSKEEYESEKKKILDDN